MQSFSQLRLFEDVPGPRATRQFGEGPLDAASEHWLAIFCSRRLASGASADAVRRDLSQLRTTVRLSASLREPLTIADLFSRVGRVAEVVRDPPVTPARSTGRARYIAIQRFLSLMCSELGWDKAAKLVELDALLPKRTTHGWYSTGTLVAGSLTRRRAQGVTLSTDDLRRILSTTDSCSPRFRLRDRTLLALHCFTGLRAREIVGLKWEAIQHLTSASNHHVLAAAVIRQERELILLLPEPAGSSLAAFASVSGLNEHELRGPIFRRTPASARPLTAMAARNIVVAACRRAGLPPANCIELRAAGAQYLRSHGLSDHETAQVFGYIYVKSLDRLLSRHAALFAQRAVRELESS